MKYNVLMAVVLLFSTAGFAQDYKSKPTESSMSIKGTSTLHDWESKVESFSINVTVNKDVIERAVFKADVRSIKSGTASMDENTYKAMNEAKFPSIEFRSKEPLRLQGGRFVIKGDLTIAGVTKTVEFAAISEKWSDASISINGSHTFKMSDFGIEPPRAMLGTIRTGDEVTVSFSTVMYM